MSAARRLAFAALLAALAAAGAGLLANRQHRQAIDADLAAAEAALRAGDPARTAGLARAVLAREPVRGRAVGLLARALEGEGGEAATRARYEAAARRAPRDPAVRGWLATRALEAGDYAAAIDHLDALLTVAPAQRKALLDLVVQLAADPAFADALATHLVARPQWRSALLRAAATGPAEAADGLHGALRARGGLDASETARWIDGMLRDGRWGSAYARWVSGLADPPERLPVPWNGDFSRAPSSAGFDWRVRRVPGVLFDRIDAGPGGHAARLRFLGRPVARAGLEVPLLLAPGDHVLHVRVRTVALRSEQGLEWWLDCSGGPRIARGARVREARQWTELELPFTVPDDPRCEGQWLRLVNPAPRGVAQTLRGELHVTGVRIVRAAPAS